MGEAAGGRDKPESLHYPERRAARPGCCSGPGARRPGIEKSRKGCRGCPHGPRGRLGSLVPGAEGGCSRAPRERHGGGGAAPLTDVSSGLLWGLAGVPPGGRSVRPRARSLRFYPGRRRPAAHPHADATRPGQREGGRKETGTPTPPWNFHFPLPSWAGGFGPAAGAAGALRGNQRLRGAGVPARREGCLHCSPRNGRSPICDVRKGRVSGRTATRLGPVLEGVVPVGAGGGDRRQRGRPGRNLGLGCMGQGGILSLGDSSKLERTPSNMFSL